MTMTHTARGIWKPPLWVTPLPEEPPHGIYLRLAERNGFRSIGLFENVTGIKLRQVRLGRDLDHLAAMLRCEPQHLNGALIKYQGQGPPNVGGEAVRRKDLMIVGRRACPACLATSAHHRFWWDLRFVAACPMHAIRLAHRCSCGGKLTWADGSLAKCRTCDDGDVRLLPFEPASCNVIALDRWVLSRFGILNDSEKVAVIHKLPLGQAIEVIERIGALAVGGYRTRWQEITDFDLPPEEVRAIGFRTLADGKLPKVLDRVHDGLLASSGKWGGLHNIYGWFSLWFRQRGGPRLSTDLAEIILKHAQGRTQVSRLAFPSLSRSNDSLTLSEASRMCRVRHGTLRKLLAAENLIRQVKRKGSPVMIPFETAKRMANDLATSVNLREAAEIVGVNRETLREISRRGAIPTWVRGGTVAKTYLFRRADVIVWIDRHIGGAQPVTVAPEGMVTIADAARATSIGITVLLNGIANGDIRVEGVLEGKSNFRGALVQLEAVRAYRKLAGPNVGTT
jgi:TniQ/Helix-turn-helix domain